MKPDHASIRSARSQLENELMQAIERFEEDSDMRVTKIHIGPIHLTQYGAEPTGAGFRGVMITVEL